MSQLEQLGMFADTKITPEPKPAAPANVTAIDKARFARTHVRSDGPATSAAAAADAPQFVGTHCERILAAMATMPEHGWTQTELAEATKLDRYQVNKRVPDLIEQGLVRRDGSVRENAGGNPELCNYLTPKEPA